VPAIVAESLASVPDPLLTALRPGPWATAAQVARALARGVLPAEASIESPVWLLPHQRASLRRVVAAIGRYQAAILADPVGSGKTYVALAAGLALKQTGATACLVPAALVGQWRAVAMRLGIAVQVVSHERVSRGSLPGNTRGLVVIDESHHFRNPATRRYRHLAPWLIGRPALLLTATPIVNRLEDLTHQLLLGIRDDALLADGVVSLRMLLRSGNGSPGLGRVVIESPCPPVGTPERTELVSLPAETEVANLRDALERIERLRLSRAPSVAGLVRSVLRRAAGSSPAALAGALRRYRTLLLHARDALQAGRPIGRADIRRFTGELEEQLVWWELFPAGSAALELDLTDLEVIDAAVRATERSAEQPDGKVDRLRNLLRDGRPSLVFAARRETVRYLRDRLNDCGVAWCTGQRAGLGLSTLPRGAVLSWFRGAEGAATAPRGARHLLVTDVAAEGLDLQRAARVIHYDLPWTPMRLEQREGRAVRLGSLHPAVEVVRFAPPPELETLLQLSQTLARKAKLPGRIGLGISGRRVWRWRSELAGSIAAGDLVSGVARVRHGIPGVLAGFSLYAETPGGELRLSDTLVWINRDGSWSEDERAVAGALEAASRGEAPSEPDPEGLRLALVSLSRVIRGRLGQAQGRRWALPQTEPAAHRVALTLQDAIRRAARSRNLAQLTVLERALGFTAGGHTAGEVLLLERLASLRGAGLLREARRVPPPTERWGPPEVRLTGLVLFGDSVLDPTAQVGPNPERARLAPELEVLRV
jgi:superfamily II DNA or RNA helicase